MASGGYAGRFNGPRGKSIVSRNCVFVAFSVVALVIVYAYTSSIPSLKRRASNDVVHLRPALTRPKRLTLEEADPAPLAAPVPNDPTPDTANVVDASENYGDCDPAVEECLEVLPGDPRYDCIVTGNCDALRARSEQGAVQAPPVVPPVVAAAPVVVAAAAQPDARPPPSAAAQVVSPPAPATAPLSVGPPRPAEWVPAQRPIAGERARPASRAWEELTVASLNPPRALATYPRLESEELASRLVLAVGCGVHSGGTHIDRDGIVSLPVFNTMMPSFVPTAQTNFIYRFYFAFDHNDGIYESVEWRARVEAEFKRYVVEEDAKRFHREGYVPGVTIDDTALIVTLHWVHCNYASKPAWAHSDAVMAAYREGADYAYRPNDDTRFPEVPDWADKFILDLRERKPISNLGVVGPRCGEGANWILTHDFTHVTHAYIFGYQYPRSLPNWSSDDWITYVYKFSELMSKRDDVPVRHMMHGQRYAADPQGQRLAVLNAAVHEGGVALNEWTQKAFGVVLPRTETPITCC